MHYFIELRIRIVIAIIEHSLYDARVDDTAAAATFASVTASSIKAICVMNFAAGMGKKPPLVRWETKCD